MITTTAPTLIDRYVFAVTENVPRTQRADVAAELRASLADAVDDQLAAGSSPEEAERAAVIQLGDPALMAARLGGRPLYLIGPAWFTAYVQLLRLLLAIVVPIVAVVVVLARAVAGDSPGSVVLGAVGAAFGVGVQLCFWVTVAFALLDRAAPAERVAWTPDRLPAVPDRRIGLSETVLSVASLVLLVLFLFWQRTHWLVPGAGGTDVPMVNPALWSFWIPVLMVLLVALMVLEVVTYRTGRWTVPLAIVNSVLNLGFAAIVVGLWHSGPLLNPEAALPEVARVSAGLVPWIVAVAAVVDTAEGWLALRRAPSGGRRVRS